MPLEQLQSSPSSSSLQRQSSCSISQPAAQSTNASAAQPGTSTAILFHGLRVRMGVATGQLLPGQEVKNCGVVDLAKAVSDMGCGGQVLLDECTFADVKERLKELGAVDAAGINWKRLTGRRSWARWITCRWVHLQRHLTPARVV